MSEKSYLVGYPIAHSKSPVMYHAAYRCLGLPWNYDLAPCETEDEARRFLTSGDFLSVNITMPYKPLALEVATHRAASAKLARGANLLVRHDDAYLAYNTDGQGCVAYLERTGFCFAGTTVVVCGTGPTARAILHACSVAGASEVVLMGRDKDHTKQVLADYVERLGVLAHATVDLPPAVEHHRSLRAAYEETSYKFGSYATSTQIVHDADLVVNATPLGMTPDDEPPFDPSLLRTEQNVFDVVYGHGETALVKAARAAGCVVHDGSGMLVAQAVASVQTVVDITRADVDLTSVDLFAIMAEAAGFTC